MKRMVFRTLFWLTWPLIWLYTPFRRSARIMIVKDGMFLAVKPYFGGGWWQLPGGGIKSGETGANAAARELQEEIGITTTDMNKLVSARIYVERGLFLRYVIYIYYMQPTDTITHNKEIEMCAWLPLTNDITYGAHVQEAIRAIDASHLL